MKSNIYIIAIITTYLIGYGVVFGAERGDSEFRLQSQDSTDVCATQWCTVSNLMYQNKNGATKLSKEGKPLSENQQIATPATNIGAGQERTAAATTTTTEGVAVIGTASENIKIQNVSARKTNRKYPLFALKTNLLFDALTALNVEIEVPFGKRWSVAGEWMFPWYLAEKPQNCLQVLSGNLEFRYWFKKHPNRADQLTGWFVGLYAGGGLYDIEWQRKGYQGEFYIAAGVSGGYAHNITRSGNLRMEYSLGLGYLKTNYRQYEARESDNGLLWKADGRYTWVGPTRAKVSLVWMMDWGKMLKKEGGRK